MSQRQAPYQRRRARRPFWQRISTAGWLFIGLIMGMGAGLYYAWVAEPVVYTNASPARLSDAHKAEYIFLVSQSYAVGGDWPRAQQRLAALEDPNLAQTVNSLLESQVRDLQPPETLRHMAALAQQLGAEGGAVAIFNPTPNLLPTPTLAAPVAVTPLPSATPAPTSTPAATATLPVLQPTAPLAYRLLSQERFCEAEAAPRIAVITQDGLLADLPGVEVWVRWAAGSDRFYTGFKPDEGAGYGDFAMEKDMSYTVVLAEGSPEVSGLRVEPCDNGRDGGWQLHFQRLAGATVPGRGE